ncbi:unnamed protein product, partial [Prorocentrum cordatum]
WKFPPSPPTPPPRPPSFCHGARQRTEGCSANARAAQEGKGPLSREAVGGSRRVRAERRSGRSAHRADGPRCIIAGRSGWRRGARARVHRESGRIEGAEGRGGGGVPERGDGTRSPPCAQLRRRRPPLALEEGRTLRGPSLWETPEGEADIILRDLGHMWASGRLVVLNRRIPVACSAGRLPRQANVRGRRGGRARAAGRGRRGGGEQQKHEDEKEALKRGTKKLAPTRRRATLPRAREEPAGEARRRRASRRRHISGAPRRAEAARRRTGGSGERHQHTNSEVRADFEHIQSSA